MKIGDRVLAINGINVTGATLQDAHNLMRQCRGITLFLIEYDVAIVGKNLLQMIDIMVICKYLSICRECQTSDQSIAN